MAKVYDISAKLTNERPTLKLSEDKEFPIDDRRNTFLLLNQKMKGGLDDAEGTDEIIQATLGKEAAKEIEAMNLPMSAYQSIVIAIMAAMTGEDMETAERRFREFSGT